MASTVMSYHMMGMAGMIGMKGMSSQAEVQLQSQNMSMMDHSNHNMASDSDGSLTDSADATDATEECCNKICNCFTGGCSSIAALIKQISNSPILDNSAKILSHSSLALSQQLTSLYRPPILS